MIERYGNCKLIRIMPMPMPLSRISIRAFAGLALTATVAQAQPSPSATQGYLNFRGASAGSPTTPEGWPTGPYSAGFSTLDMTSAYGASAFNVFCIDVLSPASESSMLVQTFSQALTNGPLVQKFAAPPGTAGGLTQLKLQQAAWLTTRFAITPQAQWDEMHVALWSIFWTVGANGLPNYAAYGGSPKTSQEWFNDAVTAGSSFDASGFRVFVPVTSLGPDGLLDPTKQVFIAQVVPEPSTYALLGAGLLAIALVGRRRRGRR
jgi:hypothetical protein